MVIETDKEQSVDGYLNQLWGGRSYRIRVYGIAL